MYCKIIISGSIIEVTEYEKLHVNGFQGDREGDGLNKEENYNSTKRQRRCKVRQLICENFDEGSKFVTLTFRDTEEFDIKNVKECNKKFKQFVQRMKYRYPEFLYVAVIEFQDSNNRGAVHYHMVCNIPYIKAKELSDIWENGNIKINRIKQCDNVGAYVTKYMVVDMDDERLQGLQAYNRSRGLLEPVELASWRKEEYDQVQIILQSLEGKTPSYGGQPYESENAGTILYRQYNKKREKLQ